jgi:hypothetical protein
MALTARTVAIDRADPVVSVTFWTAAGRLRLDWLADDLTDEVSRPVGCRRSAHE